MADQLFWCGLLLWLSAEHESTAAAQRRRRRVARRLLRLLVVECPTVERRTAADEDGYRQHNDSSCSQRPSAVPSDGNMAGTQNGTMFTTSSPAAAIRK